MESNGRPTTVFRPRLHHFIYSLSTIAWPAPSRANSMAISRPIPAVGAPGRRLSFQRGFAIVYLYFSSQVVNELVVRDGLAPTGSLSAMV